MNLQNTNEKIITLIHHEYIERLVLFNKPFIQRSSYIFMIENSDCQWCHYPNRLLVIIDFVTRHIWNYFNSFIHIMYKNLVTIIKQYFAYIMSFRSS
jgi:hypothetical protein